MKLELYSQPFCAPCVRARQVVARAAALLPELETEEINVVSAVERGEQLGIGSTPVIRMLESGQEKFRAAGVPQLAQLLAAVARAQDEPATH